MTSLHAYRLVEDAWTGGVADWCRRASPFVLAGGRAWIVTPGDGQAHWIKQRLLAENVSLFGVQFLDARSLRRELCLRAALPPPALGRETLQFLLRLHATDAGTPGSEWSTVARHPEACLGALDDLAAAGWLDKTEAVGDFLPPSLADWLPALRATGSWTPDIDLRLAEFYRAASPDRPPLSLCIFGWDAHYWSEFHLLTAAVRAAAAASLYLPLPRGTAEAIQQSWLDACETAVGAERQDCDDSGFVSSQAVLAERLEGADLEECASFAPPELLTGADARDTALLVRDYVARWLHDTCADGSHGAKDGSQRLGIVCPGRNASAVALVRALVQAGIAVEDELGERPEPALAVQIQRAIIDYHLDRAGLDSLLALVELLNEHAAVWSGPDPGGFCQWFPLDPVEVRRVLQGAFAEVQHHSARFLGAATSIGRSPVAAPLRRLIDHLGEWPEVLPWPDALARWQDGLEGFGLKAEDLEALWSRLLAVPVSAPVPTTAFFEHLDAILGGVPPRGDPEASHRFARVVVTTLAGAAGQIWGGLVLLDSTEGAWPLFPPENPFLNDSARNVLNTPRPGTDPAEPGAFRGHLLTAFDRAQLESFRFLDTLQNCRGPLAFASSTRDPVDPSQELSPNEWVLRCLAEADRDPDRGDTLLGRWRHSIRRTEPTPTALGRGEAAHLREVWTRRRDPAAAFDEYGFNFSALTAPDELPWADAWSAGELHAATVRPATFALHQIFATQPWREDDRNLRRGEGWIVGRLVHRWLHAALHAGREPSRVTEQDWTRALTEGLPRARFETETSLRGRLVAGGPGDARAQLPLWWQGVLRRASWATRRCLELLAETAARHPTRPLWLAMNQHFQTDLGTPAGPLRLRAQCDVVLLDRPGLDGAVCQLIDIHTGATPSSSAPSVGQFEQGKGLHAAATLLLALAAGAESNRSRAGIVHPQAASVELSEAMLSPVVQPTLERLARQQRTLVFGQKSILADPHDGRQGETLPLATTPVDATILAAKARLTEP